MSGRKDETNDTLVHRFSTMVYVLLWPETMRKRECIGARERGRETNTHSSSSEGERHRCRKWVPRTTNTLRERIAKESSFCTPPARVARRQNYSRRGMQYHEYLSVVEPTQLRPVCCMYAKPILSHHCTRAYDVVLCEGDARAAE